MMNVQLKNKTIPMKKLMILFVAILISATTAFAGNGTTIHSVISKQLNVPTELKKNKLYEKVNVQFRISENGKASLMNVESANTELKNYIIKQFSKIDFNEVKDNKDKIYFIDINFRVL
jgi:hypothetical protein